MLKVPTSNQKEPLAKGEKQSLVLIEKTNNLPFMNTPIIATFAH